MSILEYFLSFRFYWSLTLSWRRSVSYRNQSIDLQSKLMDWFLYDRDLRHERGKINRRNGEKNYSNISAFYTLRMEWNLKSLCKIYCKYLVFTYQFFMANLWISNRIKIEKNWCRFKAENRKWDSLVSAPFFSFIGFVCTFYMHFYIVCTFCMNVVVVEIFFFLDFNRVTVWMHL